MLEGAKIDQEKQKSQNNVSSNRRRRRLSRKSLYGGRRHTAPLLDRLSQMKEQVVKEEAQYVLHLRRKSQKVQNDSVTQKVWDFIGKRPVTAFVSYKEIESAKQSTKKSAKSDDINDDESKALLRRITQLSK